MNLSWRLPGLIAVASIASASASLASNSLQELLACRSLSDAAARLACYDKEAAALASPSTAPAARAAARLPAPAPDPQQQFGLPERAVAAKEVAAGTRAADAAKIEARIARTATAADGRTVFTLDNTQVWRQLTAEDLLAKEGDEVTISRGWLASYWLQIKSGRGCKVTRVR